MGTPMAHLKRSILGHNYCSEAELDHASQDRRFTLELLLDGPGVSVRTRIEDGRTVLALELGNGEMEQLLDQLSEQAPALSVAWAS